jgi:polysulfide reductase-like protein
VSDRPVIKEPVWKPEIPFYFYSGGLAGASAGLAALSELRGNPVLARRAWATALAGAAISPALLISDLGRPARFYNMLRLFKVTSPMSVGSWVLSAFAPATAIAAADVWAGPLPVALARPAKVAASVLGLPLTTYTAALIANTAVPAWHDARRSLPAVFAAGGALSAGAAAMALTPVEHAAPARRLALAGAAAELGAVVAMERGLTAPVDAAYRRGAPHTLGRLGKACVAVGAAATAALAGRSRPAAVAGGAMLTAGAVLERWSVFRAGFASARDPAATVVPQRRRKESRTPRGSAPAP